MPKPSPTLPPHGLTRCDRPEGARASRTNPKYLRLPNETNYSSLNNPPTNPKEGDVYYNPTRDVNGIPMSTQKAHPINPLTSTSTTRTSASTNSPTHDLIQTTVSQLIKFKNNTDNFVLSHHILQSLHLLL